MKITYLLARKTCKSRGEARMTLCRSSGSSIWYSMSSWSSGRRPSSLDIPKALPECDGLLKGGPIDDEIRDVDTGLDEADMVGKSVIWRKGKNEGDGKWERTILLQGARQTGSH